MSTIYYFRVFENEELDPCATLIARENIVDALSHYDFKWLDCTGGQASFEPIGDFAVFENVVRVVARINQYNLLSVTHCLDPGVGLFL